MTTKIVQIDYDVLAEELLAEILSDITNGDLSVEYKKGLITSLKEFVSKYTGIRLNVDPTLRDVVDAINIATSNLRSGQEISEDFSSSAQNALDDVLGF